MATTDLVTKKINYTLEKKAEICEILGLTGNPTWNQIKAIILDDTVALQEIRNLVSIEWASGSVVGELVKSGEWIYKFQDGNYFYGNDTASCYINQQTNSWAAKQWIIDGITSNDKLNGRNFWNDGVNDYYSDGNKQYQYVDGQLKSKEWLTASGVNISYIKGREIWKDSDNNIYLSNNNIHYKLNNGIWEVVTSSLNFYGGGVWHVGDKTFVSFGSNNHYYMKNLNEFYRVYMYRTENEQTYSVDFLGDDVYETDVFTFRYDTKNAFLSNSYLRKIAYLSYGTGNFYIDGNLKVNDSNTYPYKMELKPKKWTGQSSLYSRGFWSYKGVLYCDYNTSSINVRVHQKTPKDYTNNINEWTVAAVQYEVEN